MSDDIKGIGYYGTSEFWNSSRCISELKPSLQLGLLPLESPRCQLSKTSKIIVKLLFTKKISSIQDQKLMLS